MIRERLTRTGWYQWFLRDEMFVTWRPAAGGVRYGWTTLWRRQ